MSRDHYFAEMERTRKDFFYMGDLAKTALADALLGVTASDAAAARVTGMLGAIADLELIGDYADDIAVLARADDRWRTADRVDDVSLRPAQTIVKRSCQDLMGKVAQLRPTPGNTVNVGLIPTRKYLERIASHSVSLAEQAVFVSGAA